MVSNGDFDLAITGTDCHHFESKTTARTAQSGQPSVPFQKKMRNQPQPASEVTSTALSCRHTPGLLQFRLVITVWAADSSPGACSRAGGSDKLLQEGNPCLPVTVQATSLQQPRKEPGKSVQPSHKAFPHHRCQPTTAGLIFYQCLQVKEE